MHRPIMAVVDTLIEIMIPMPGLRASMPSAHPASLCPLRHRQSPICFYQLWILKSVAGDQTASRPARCKSVLKFTARAAIVQSL
jgi:hypothetical protein